MDNKELVDRLHKAIEICENTGAGHYGAAFSAGELRLLVTALEAATYPAPAVVQMTDERCLEILKAMAAHVLTLPEDTTEEKFAGVSVNFILSASGVCNE